MNNPKLKIEAPWTQEQVDSLNAYQKCGLVHSYTCPNCSCELEATIHSWYCTDCDEYVQNWALYFATIFDKEEYLKANKDIGKFVQRCSFMADDFLTEGVVDISKTNHI